MSNLNRLSNSKMFLPFNWTIKMNLVANFSGASSLNAKDLETLNSKLSLSGACSADVTVIDNLAASISGAGNITYGGNPKSVDKHVSGVAKIQAR